MRLERILLAGMLAAACSHAIAAVDPAMIKARQKFFGAENVDAATGAVKKDKVIFSWATNTTYVTSILGRVVMLDSYVTRLELAPGRTPFVIQDLVDVKPEAIFLGHGHFDRPSEALAIDLHLQIGGGRCQIEQHDERKDEERTHVMTSEGAISPAAMMAN